MTRDYQEPFYDTESEPARTPRSSTRSISPLLVEILLPDRSSPSKTSCRESNLFSPGRSRSFERASIMNDPISTSSYASNAFSSSQSATATSSRTTSDPVSNSSFRANPFSFDNRPITPMITCGNILTSLIELGEKADQTSEAISKAMELSTLKYYTKKTKGKLPLTDKLRVLGDLVKQTGRDVDMDRESAFAGIGVHRLYPALNTLFGKLKMICVILQTAIDEKKCKRRSKKSRDEILDSLGAIHRGVELMQRAVERHYMVALDDKTEVAKTLLFLKKCRVVWSYEVDKVK